MGLPPGPGPVAQHPGWVLSGRRRTTKGDFDNLPAIYLPAVFLAVGLAWAWLKAIAVFTRALNAEASTFSPWAISMARRMLPSRLALKSWAGSASEAPFAKVNFTLSL